jgi:hypothetical protein
MGRQPNYEPFIVPVAAIPDLFNANLSYSNLSQGNLTHTNLSCANLKNAIFQEADLTNATFNYSDLTNTDFTDTKIENTFFQANIGLSQETKLYLQKRGAIRQYGSVSTIQSLEIPLNPP